MANNNFNNFNQPFNYGQSNNQEPNTCRLCNNVFTSVQAFIIHIESHLAHENAAMRRQYSPIHVGSQRELITNLMQTNFHRPVLMQETRNNANGRVFQAPPQQPVVMFQERTGLFSYASQVATSQPVHPLEFPPEIMPSARNTVAETTQLPTPSIDQEMEMEVSPIDNTRPYINLLDKPINNNEFINMVNIYGGNPDLQALDLVLRL